MSTEAEGAVVALGISIVWIREHLQPLNALLVQLLLSHLQVLKHLGFLVVLTMFDKLLIPVLPLFLQGFLGASRVGATTDLMDSLLCILPQAVVEWQQGA